MKISADTKTREPSEVKKMFARVAKHYDAANRAMTLGLDIIWRKKLVKTVTEIKKSGNFVDIASGSGDVAIELLKSCKDTKVTCADFCPQMLDVAKKKMKDFANRTTFVEADCANLPFENQFFDGATISFGFRNFKNRQECLVEIHRVLKSDSKIAMLEVAKAVGIFAIAQKYFMKIFAPILATICGGKREDYIYLAKSTLEYPSNKEVKSMFENAGFKDVKIQKLAFGLVAITHAKK